VFAMNFAELVAPHARCSAGFLLSLVLCSRALQSYGDESDGKGLLYPGHHAVVGVEDTDFRKERAPEQVSAEAFVASSLWLFRSAHALVWPGVLPLRISPLW
jgi:hypothetical protein